MHPLRLNEKEGLGVDGELWFGFLESVLFGGYLREAVQQPVGCWRLMLVKKSKPKLWQWIRSSKRNKWSKKNRIELRDARYLKG